MGLELRRLQNLTGELNRKLQFEENQNKKDMEILNQLKLENKSLSNELSKIKNTSYQRLRVI